MRPTLVPIAACAVLFLALVSCDSPGEPYRYRDLKIQPGITVSKAVPASTDAVTLSFGIFNTDLEPMDQVEWQALQDGAPTPIASGTVDLPKQTWASASFTVAPGPGVHTFTVALDPGNRITNESDEANNLQSVTLVFADPNLSFEGAPVVTPAAPTAADALTVTATVRNTDTSGALAPVSDVVVLVREGDADLASTTIPALAAGATATAAIPLPAATAGSHIYTIIIDPASAITVRDRSRTITMVTVTVVAVAPG